MNKNTNITEHFTLYEVVHSGKAAELKIDNSVPEELFPTIQNTCNKLELIRYITGDFALIVHSFYRCLELNRALKSSDNSQHVKGEAVDFTVPSFGTVFELCKFLEANKELIKYDQLIFENKRGESWAHISFCSNPNVQPRLSALTLHPNGDYLTGIIKV